STRASSTSPASAFRLRPAGWPTRWRRPSRRPRPPAIRWWSRHRSREAGGVKLAGDADEVRLHAGNILGLDIKGHVVKRLWIEHASDIAREYYASFTLDRPNKRHLGMLSAEGGVEIEEVAVSNPDAIAMLPIDPIVGLDEVTAREWVDRANLDPEARDQAATLLTRLYACYVEGDCDL